MDNRESARRLKEAMNDKKMKAVELSTKSGVGKAAISHYINGRSCPHNKNAVALANVLDVNPTWLMGLDVPKKINRVITVSSLFTGPANENTPNGNDEFLIEFEKISDDKKKMDLLIAYMKLLNGGD